MEHRIATEPIVAAFPRPEYVRRVAVIDLGSNTVRVLVCDVSATGMLHVVDEEAVLLELGREIRDGHIDERVFTRVLDVLEDFALIARGAGADSAVAVATAALRTSANVGALVRVAKRRFGIPIEVVDGDQEAQLAFDGAIYNLPEEDGLLLDLGGGSAEFVEFRDRRLMRTWSLPLGGLRIADRFLSSDPPAPGEVRAAREHIDRALTNARLPVLADRQVLVGTGGSVRNLSRVDRRRRRYPVARLQGYPLKLERLQRLTARLFGLGGDDRATTPGLNPQRVHSILGGALVLEAVAQHVGAVEVITAGEGLREGRARDLGGRDLPSRDVVRQAALEHFQAGLPPAERERIRQRTALAASLHVAFGVEPDTLEVVKDAATLIALGDALDFYNRGSRASEVVLAAGIPGFSHVEIARIAAVLRLTEREDAPLVGLTPLVSPAEHPALRQCAALLSLADAVLRRTHPGRAPDIEVTRTDDVVTLSVPEWPRRASDDPTARIQGLFVVRLTVVARG